MEQDGADNGEELELVRRAAHGDHEAFRHLVLFYEPRLLAYLTQMIGDVENAHDVAQETFIAIYHALPTWQPDTYVNSMNINRTHPLSPWLYRIATNRAISLLRKQTVRQRFHTSLRDNTSPQSSIEIRTASNEHSLEEQFIARELLREALSQLAEEDAACVILHFIAGERYAEIALRLGLTSEAVRKRIFRALTTLRALYATLDTEVHS